SGAVVVLQPFLGALEVGLLREVLGGRGLEQPHALVAENRGCLECHGQEGGKGRPVGGGHEWSSGWARTPFVPRPAHASGAPCRCCSGGWRNSLPRPVARRKAARPRNSA